MNSATTARVLVVEDDPLLAQLVVKYLERDSFTVEHTSDGTDAVARAHGFRPDVVILDIGLPGIDGLEVCRRLRQFSDCYVIMLTARDDEIDKLVGLTVGADDYLTKPFSHRELVARVKVMLRRPPPCRNRPRRRPHGRRPAHRPRRPRSAPRRPTGRAHAYRVRPARRTGHPPAGGAVPAATHRGGMGTRLGR